MFTTEELVAMGGIISTVYQFVAGKVTRKVGSTINYYRQNADGTWDNTNCRTVY